MEKEEKYLKDIKHESGKQAVHKWKYCAFGKNTIRLYYMVIDKGSALGFLFHAVEWAGCDANHIQDQWNLESCQVEHMCSGVAYFDGIRHMHLGDEGYISCPTVEYLADIMTALKLLCEAHCEEYP